MGGRATGVPGIKSSQRSTTPERSLESGITAQRSPRSALRLGRRSARHRDPSAVTAHGRSGGVRDEEYGSGWRSDVVAVRLYRGGARQGSWRPLVTDREQLTTRPGAAPPATRAWAASLSRSTIGSTKGRRVTNQDEYGHNINIIIISRSYIAACCLTSPPVGCLGIRS